MDKITHLLPNPKQQTSLLIYSLSFCFRGERGLEPLKQMENEDLGESSLHKIKLKQPEEKNTVGGRNKEKDLQVPF